LRRRARVVWSRTSCTAGMPCRHAKKRRSMLQLSVARSKLVHLACERCSIPPWGILFLQPQSAHGTELGLTPPTSARWDWARPSHPCHTCTGTGLTPPTGTAAETAWRPVPLQPHPHRDWNPLPPLSRDWGSPLPNLHRDWAHPCRICTGTWAHPCRICTVTGFTPPTSAPGLGSPHPHLHRDWAHPTHICTGTRLTAATPPTRIRQPGLQLQQAGFPLGPHSLPLSK
jgi:hypothetical protein